MIVQGRFAYVKGGDAQPLDEFFGTDPDSYNCGSTMEGPEADGSGRPGIALAAAAIAFWVGQRRSGDPCTIGAAAAAFNMPPAAVRQACDYHSWLLVYGADDLPLADMRIEQDGE